MKVMLNQKLQCRLNEGLPTTLSPKVNLNNLSILIMNKKSININFDICPAS